MTREKRKKLGTDEPVQKPRPKFRRDPLPIKIKAEHHLSSLLADGSATDLTIAAFEREQLPFDVKPVARGRRGTSRVARPTPTSHQKKLSGIPSDTPSGIPAGIPDGIPDKPTDQLISQEIYRSPETSQVSLHTKPLYVHLDATRTPNEQKLYSNLLRDLRRRAAELEPVYGKNTGRYGYSELLRLTGIRSRTTLRVAIEGLLIKEDIEIVERTKMGTIYRVREPKEILEIRQSKGVLIDPSTKWIYSKGGQPVDWSFYLKRITGESRTLSLVRENQAAGVSDGIPDGIPGGVSDGISEHVSDGIPESDTPVYQNLTHLYKYLNRPVGLTELNSSSNRQKKDDDDDETQTEHQNLHQRSVQAIYECYTGNKWRPSDENAYRMVSNLLLEVIEAGIISSVLRCPTRVNSLSYCLGAIFEFNDFLPPGYLLYLRRRFQQLRGSGDRAVPNMLHRANKAEDESGS